MSRQTAHHRQPTWAGSGPNRLAQLPPPTGPDQVRATDITYIETGEGWLYLTAILDLWSRRIVGWACAPTLQYACEDCIAAPRQPASFAA